MYNLLTLSGQKEYYTGMVKPALIKILPDYLTNIIVDYAVDLSIVGYLGYQDFGELENLKNVRSWAVLPNGNIILSIGKCVQIFEKKTLECIATLELTQNHTLTPTNKSYCVMSEGRIIISSDSLLKILDINDLKCMGTLEGHSGMVTSFCVLASGKIVSASEDNTLIVWDPETMD